MSQGTRQRTRTAMRQGLCRCMARKDPYRRSVHMKDPIPGAHKALAMAALALITVLVCRETGAAPPAVHQANNSKAAQIAAASSPQALQGFEARRKSAIEFRPFTARDFSRGSRKRTHVPLKNGKTLRIADFLRAVNDLERRLNAYGTSLRSAIGTEEPIEIGVWRVRVKTDTRKNTDNVLPLKDGQPSRVGNLGRRRSSAVVPVDRLTHRNIPTGPLPKLEPLTKTSVVLDPDLIGVRIKGTADAKNGAEVIEARNNLEMQACGFGACAGLLQMYAWAEIPAGMAPRDPLRKAAVHIAALGVPLQQQTRPESPATNVAVASVPGISFTRRENLFSHRAMLGPIPVKLEVGFDVGAGADVASRGGVAALSNNVTAQAQVSVVVRAHADIVIAGAGIDTYIHVLDMKYKLDSAVRLTRMPAPGENSPSTEWRWTQVEWTRGSSFQIESGSGKVTVVFMVDLGPLGDVAFAFDIVTWGGHVWSDNSPSTTQQVQRPAGCGHMYHDALCAGPHGSSCESLLSSVEHCGGCNEKCRNGEVCTNGQCKAESKPPSQPESEPTSGDPHGQPQCHQASGRPCVAK